MIGHDYVYEGHQWILRRWAVMSLSSDAFRRVLSPILAAFHTVTRVGWCYQWQLNFV